MSGWHVRWQQGVSDLSDFGCCAFGGPQPGKQRHPGRSMGGDYWQLLAPAAEALPSNAAWLLTSCF